jgi:uncharacterized membrane protein YfhO
LTLEQPPADAVESAQIVDFEPDRIVIRTQSVAAGLLVVSEIYADGWNAQIDGESADVVPTNHVLRGVPLPKGQHEVVLTYAPRSLQVGVVLSAASTVAMQGVFAFAALPLARRRSLAIRGSAQPAAA